MNNKLNLSLMSLTLASLLALSGCGTDSNDTNDTNETEKTTHEVAEQNVSDTFRADQSTKLLEASDLTTTPPQSPRDIDSVVGTNANGATIAPKASELNLCDIHFHKSAEHKGGEFTTYAGNGNEEGYGTGWKYNKASELNASELASYNFQHSEQSEHNPLYPGDTIEVHYVYSNSKDAHLGNGLGTCLNSDKTEPSALRVESEVYVLVNDVNAYDFTKINKVTSKENNASYYVATSIPNFETNNSVEYKGSTTGPGYDEKPSPYHVTWNVRKHVEKVNIATVDKWLESNDFNETHAHGVRNLVINPVLISEIK